MEVSTVKQGIKSIEVSSLKTNKVLSAHFYLLIDWFVLTRNISMLANPIWGSTRRKLTYLDKRYPSWIIIFPHLTTRMWRLSTHSWFKILMTYKLRSFSREKIMIICKDNSLNSKEKKLKHNNKSCSAIRKLLS